jgi:hypothetical protein
MPTSTQPRWTKREDELIRTLSARAAAKRIGRTVRAVYNRRHKLGCRPDCRPWTEVEDRLIVTLPPEQAARYLNRTRLAIYERLRRLGLIGRAT